MTSIGGKEEKNDRIYSLNGKVTLKKKVTEVMRS